MQTVQDVYASRSGEKPEIRPRQDPVVYKKLEEIKSPHLTAEEAAFFDKNGYLLKKNLFSPEEVSLLMDAAKKTAQEEGAKDSPCIIREPDGPGVRSVFAVHQLGKVFDAVSRDARVLDVVSNLLDSQVYIHQSRINLKPGFEGKEFYWHSDFETWHMEDGMPRMRAISCSISLTENNEFNGPLMVVPGSHRSYIICVGKTPDNHYQKSLRKQEYGVPDQGSLTKVVEESGIVSAKGPAGSALFFDCNIMHGSAGNISPWPRSNVFLVFNSMKNTLEAPYAGTTPRPLYVATREFNALQPLPGGASFSKAAQ